MAEFFVARSNELNDGERKIITAAGHEIGVFRINGSWLAVLNVCPHQGGPVCEGLIIHRVEEVLGIDKTYKGLRFTEDLNLVCPWHGWEFDVATGNCSGDGKRRLLTFPVIERDGEVHVVVD